MPWCTIFFGFHEKSLLSEWYFAHALSDKLDYKIRLAGDFQHPVGWIGEGKTITRVRMPLSLDWYLCGAD